jgi:hypothetical protein
MRTSVTIIVAVAGLTLGACGSSDDGSDLSDAQAAAAQSVIDAAAEDGVTLDEACVEEIAAQLSEEDAELAAQDGDAELSAAGNALGEQLLECASDEEIIDLFIASIGDENIDADCAREALGEFDMRELMQSAAADGDPPAELIQALVPCLSGG